MPYDDPDPVDPMALVGVEVPAGEDVVPEMAEVFVEEFLRMGHSPAEVLALFRNPFYAGPHRAWQALGEAHLRALVQSYAPPGAAWGLPAIQAAGAAEGRE